VQRETAGRAGCVAAVIATANAADPPLSIALLLLPCLLPPPLPLLLLLLPPLTGATGLLLPTEAAADP
jgi:hypothetical protein